MKCSFVDICVIIKFQESNFPVTAHNLILIYQEIEKLPIYRKIELHRFDLNNSPVQRTLQRIFIQ